LGAVSLFVKPVEMPMEEEEFDFNEEFIRLMAVFKEQLE